MAIAHQLRQQPNNISNDRAFDGISNGWAFNGSSSDHAFDDKQSWGNLKAVPGHFKI